METLSNAILETITDVSKTEKLSLLRDMYNEVDFCFDNFSSEQSFQIKNFIESFINEL